MTGRGAPAIAGSLSLIQPGVRDGAVVLAALLVGLLVWRVTGERLPGGGDPSRLPAAFTTSTIQPLRSPGSVRVLVLNASGQANRATILSESLRAAGYQTLPPGNAPRQSETVIHFRPDFGREADALSREAGAARVLPLEAPGSIAGAAGAAGADCVVVIGSG